MPAIQPPSPQPSPPSPTNTPPASTPTSAAPHNLPVTEHDQAPQTPWHAHTVDATLQAFAVTASVGLSGAEAQARLQQHGPNALAQLQPPSSWMRFALQFHNPLIYVLLVAAAITVALQSYVDAGVIVGVVLINALIGYVQEGKAQRALDAVRNMLAAQATVLRGGERQRVDANTLVPGDMVLLESGDKVPADLRLTQAKNLRVTEAALTGESVPVEKNTAAVPADATLADRACLCYCGTLVAYGQAQGVVVATGAHTELGRIGTLVGELHNLATPLTRRLDQFARQITAFILLVAVVTLLYGHYVAAMPLLDVFLAVVGLAVAAIPEGMPAVVTIVLAVGTRAMAHKNAIVRRLPAVETLGSVTVICSDKTGTLTRNEMTAVRVVTPDATVQVTGSGYAPEGGFVPLRAAPGADAWAGSGVDSGLGEGSGAAHTTTHLDDLPAVQALARAVLLCNDAQLSVTPKGDWQMVGDPTEGALLTLAHKAGLDAHEANARYPRLDAISFESERQYMATLHHDHASHHFVLLKGAPERVLALCERQAGGQPLDLAYWQAQIHQAAAAGERVLAVAQCDWPHESSELDVADITQRFEFLGLVGIIDPPRAEAIAAVAECQSAGIRVKMITGDHAVTAAAIGQQLGLQAQRTLTGEAIAAMDDATLKQQAWDIDIFARASPEHKLRLIAALQASGHLVAMTGDGVNDAPALKAADIGVAMGQKGTDAAREASDLVLTDDNFATIARAVREGRVVFDNIKKSLMHMLPTNGGEAGVILLAIFAGLPLPVTAGQILWVNTVTAVTLAISLAFEPAEKGVMQLAPRPTTEPIITRALGLRILFVIALMVSATFVVFNWELARGSSLELARTAAVNMIVMCEVFYLFNVRHFTRHAFHRETLSGNPVALLVCAILLVLQMLFTYAPPMQQLFNSQPLDLVSWLVITAFAGVLFLGVEAEKAVLRRAAVHRI